MKPYFEEAGITIYHGDCLDVMPTFANYSFDVMFTDPPYNCGKDYGTASDDRHDYDEWVRRVCHDFQWVANSYCIVAPTRKLGVWTHALDDGWIVGMKMRAANAIRKGWENKLSLLWTNMQPAKPEPNLWEDLRFRGEGYFFREETYGHEGYTPECLTRRVLSLNLERPLTSVLDIFAGTGTTLAVAKDLGLKAVGIEIEERWCEVAANRLRQGVLSFDIAHAPRFASVVT